MERVVNIIGMGKSSLNCPDTGENWGINSAYKSIKKLDKLFFMDGFESQLIDDSLTRINGEIYTFDMFLKDNPNVELISKYDDNIKDLNGNIVAKINGFPLTESLKLLPGGYFTSTIAYMIAYAIMQKVDRLRLYGFELWSGSDANEYTKQAPCVEFWLAFAMGRGIKVEIPYQIMLTRLNNQNYYGYVSNDFKRDENRIIK